jgi:hypothetical protein
MKHPYDATCPSCERPGDSDLPNLTARLPEIGADVGIIGPRRRPNGQGGYSHELAEDAQREAGANGSYGHQTAGPVERSQPPRWPAGGSRPNGAPAYYLGRPASLFLSICRPRRKRTVSNHLADAFSGHRRRTPSQDTVPIAAAENETVYATPISA